MNSNQRIVEILFKLLSENDIEKKSLKEEYGVTLRTIQRDFSTIQKIASQFNYELFYNEFNRTYKLISPNRLNSIDVLPIIKILLSSRGLSKDELTSLIDKLVLDTENKGAVFESINNELTFYHSLTHNKNLINLIDELNQSILSDKVIEIDYENNRKRRNHFTLLPVSIIFSDYYFYTIGYDTKKERYMIIRVDRIISIKKIKNTYTIPRKDRIEERELREKMLYMYSGKQKTFTFRFWGITEAALDKFPNSEIIKHYDDNSVLIKATAYETGTMMWLLSQGKNVKVMSPPSLIHEMKKEIKKMTDLYE